MFLFRFKKRRHIVVYSYIMGQCREDGAREDGG